MIKSATPLDHRQRPKMDKFLPTVAFFPAQSTRAPSRALQSREGAAKRSNSFEFGACLPQGARRITPPLTPSARACTSHAVMQRPALSCSPHSLLLLLALAARALADARALVLGEELLHLLLLVVAELHSSTCSASPAGLRASRARELSAGRLRMCARAFAGLKVRRAHMVMPTCFFSKCAAIE